MFVFIGGIVGFLLAFFLFVGPGALSVAVSLGVGLVWPFQLVSLFVSLGFFAALAVQFVVVLILYFIAAIATPPVQGAVTTNPVEELCRGAQIGINACANFLYAAVLYPVIATFTVGPVPGAITAVLAPFFAVALGTITFLSVFPGLSRNFVFEATLGWSSWFMPMSWPAQVVGFAAFLIGLVASWFGRPFAALGDWWPGAVARHGWLFDFGSSAFTIGNFTIVSGSMNRTSPEIVQTSSGPAAGFLTALGVVAHETGHTLVVAAFGFLVTAIGFVHERVLDLFTGLGGQAYFEMLCEGIRRMSGDPALFPDANPWIAMWAPPAPLAGPGGGNGRVAISATIDGVAVNSGDTVSVGVGTAVALDASACVDPDDYPMGTVSAGATPSVGVRWALVTQPAGSTAAIPNATGATTTFTADVPGDYRIAFAASDGAEGELHVVDVTA